MNDRTTPPLDEIRGLVAERARFEGWLTTLASRRADTPSHVFERVWQDYDGRRQRVDDQLAQHAEALQQALTGLGERHADLDRQLAERRDALAEVELRRLVGEFDENEGSRLRAEVDGAIQALERDAEQVGRELADVRELAGQVRPPAPEPQAVEAQPEPAVESAPEPEPVPIESLAPGAPASGMGASVDPFDGRTAEPRRDTPMSSPTFVGGQGLAQAAVGVPTAPQADMPAGAAQLKTLRCQECGAMNFPTEWYCERCGGELAAL